MNTELIAKYLALDLVEKKVDVEQLRLSDFDLLDGNLIFSFFLFLLFQS